mgnify:FL=1
MKNLTSADRSLVEPISSSEGLDSPRPVVFWFKRKKTSAWTAFLACSARLQEATLTVLGAVGADAMIWLGSFVLISQLQYERSATGLNRFVASFQFKCSVKFYHLLFRFQQRIYQRHLALACPGELILNLSQSELECSGFNTVSARLSQSFTSYLKSAETASNEFSGRLTALDQLIVVHPNLPIPEVLKNSSTAGQVSK